MAIDGLEMLRRARAGIPYSEEVPEVKLPSPPPKLAVPQPARTDNTQLAPSSPPRFAVPRPPNRNDHTQLNIRLPDGMKEAAQQWCYDNRYYLRDFIIEAIQAKLKTRG